MLRKLVEKLKEKIHRDIFMNEKDGNVEVEEIRKEFDRVFLDIRVEYLVDSEKIHTVKKSQKVKQVKMK